MSSPNPPYTITFLPPPGPVVLSIPRSSSPYRPVSPTDPSIPHAFHDALAIRDAVFTIEQNCPADEDLDADDPVSWHWVLYDADAVPAATIRLIPAQAHADDDGAVAGPNYKDSRLWDGQEPYLMIGRLATRKEFRGRGYGRAVVEEALGWAVGHEGEVVRDWRDGEGRRAVWRGLLLAHAQADREKWYAGLGWRTDEGMGRWDECGIRHVAMWRRVEVRG